LSHVLRFIIIFHTLAFLIVRVLLLLLLLLLLLPGWSVSGWSGVLRKT
jgi:hypothetical protein